MANEKFIRKEPIKLLINKNDEVIGKGTLIYKVPKGCRVEYATLIRVFEQTDYNPMATILVDEMVERCRY